jgi:hypothetical protein
MSDPLAVVDGLTLPEEHRALLRPGEFFADGWGRTHRLPRFFYRVESWDQAKATKLTARFALSELMAVDCREAELLFRSFPHYVPCAVSILARYLEEFRSRVDAPVMIAVNGGYRSPAHGMSCVAGPHVWATAADIYRVGDVFLDSSKTVERFARVAESIGQEVSVKPFGHGPGETDDHLHFDLGYLHLVPRSFSEAVQA